MDLNRTGRLWAGIAAGVVVLLAAVFGVALRPDGESTALDTTDAAVIATPITNDPFDTEPADEQQPELSPTADVISPLDATEVLSGGGQVEPTPEPQPTPAPQPTPTPVAPPESVVVDHNAVCDLDRIIIYAMTSIAGSAGRVTDALAAGGFGQNCLQPPAMLASNCPLQGFGTLASTDIFDPTEPFVAVSDGVAARSIGALLESLGYVGPPPQTLDFGLPEGRWAAVFIPANFAGFERIANESGIVAVEQPGCKPDGRPDF